MTINNSDLELLNELIPTIIEIAVPVAMNVTIQRFRLNNSQEAVDKGKEELIRLVKGEVLQDGTVVLTLEMKASILVAPLRGLFTGAWVSSPVNTATTEFLKQSPVLQNVPFQLRFHTA